MMLMCFNQKTLMRNNIDTVLVFFLMEVGYSPCLNFYHEPSGPYRNPLAYHEKAKKISHVPFDRFYIP